MVIEGPSAVIKYTDVFMDGLARIRIRGGKNLGDGPAGFSHCLDCPSPFCRYDN